MQPLSVLRFPECHVSCHSALGTVDTPELPSPPPLARPVDLQSGSVSVPPHQLVGRCRETPERSFLWGLLYSTLHIAPPEAIDLQRAREAVPSYNHTLSHALNREWVRSDPLKGGGPSGFPGKHPACMDFWVLLLLFRTRLHTVA